MTIKKPLCNYGGDLKELQAGDTVDGAGGPGGGVFYENLQTVATDYTITSGSNAVSAGPITIGTGITVTVPTGSTWTVV